MVKEINKKWLHVSIERCGKEVYNDEYYKSNLTEFGLSTQNVIDLSRMILREFEMALGQTNQYDKRHLKITFNY